MRTKETLIGSTARKTATHSTAQSRTDLSVYHVGRRWTAADEVHDVLQRLVINGALKPGNRLTEVALAAQLQVSRTPLRQALQRLVSDGWLYRSANGALHVVNVSLQEIEALYAVRAALEAMVISQAATHLTAATLNELRGILLLQEQASKAEDSELVSRYGEHFHRTLWHLSGNQVGYEFLEDVLRRTTRYRRLSFVESQRFREGTKQHWQLLRALEAGDSAAVSRLLAKHIDESRKYVIQAFKAWHKGAHQAPDSARHRPLAKRTLRTRPRDARRSSKTS